MKIVFLIFSMMSIFSCQSQNMVNSNLDIQGHRGCRGLMPENTIPGFIKAIELGVTTLEMDVVVSKDSQIIVSHEPFFNHAITTLPEGKITEENEKTYNIYQMNLTEIQSIDVGLKPNSRFPLQQKMAAYKPTLQQVIDSVITFCTNHKLDPVRFNIEIKHDPRGDGIYCPNAKEMTKLVYDEIKKLGIIPMSTIQSFDPACLNILHDIDPTVTTAFLIENKESIEDNLKKLTYQPNIYSPYFKLVDSKMVSLCQKSNIKLIPWTVNEEADISKMISLGVDGIISDYPDKAIEIYLGLKPTK